MHIFNISAYASSSAAYRTVSRISGFNIHCKAQQPPPFGESIFYFYLRRTYAHGQCQYTSTTCRTDPQKEVGYSISQDMPIGNAGSLRDAATPQLASTCQLLVKYPFKCREHLSTPTPHEACQPYRAFNNYHAYDAHAVSANTC